MGLVDIETGKPIEENPLVQLQRQGQKLADLNERLLAQRKRKRRK